MSVRFLSHPKTDSRKHQHVGADRAYAGKRCQPFFPGVLFGQNNHPAVALTIFICIDILYALQKSCLFANVPRFR